MYLAVVSYMMDACDSKGEVTDCPSLVDPLPSLLANMYSLNSPGAAKDPCS